MKKVILLSMVFLAACSAFAQKTAEAKDKFADFNGVKIHYRDQGKGKNALVFIHGWTCSIEFWKKQFEGFPGRRVIFIDLPGHGKSDKPQGNYTMEYFARSIDAVLRAGKVKKAVLVGHSMGAPVIRNFYKFYPDKTAGLVLVDGSLRPFGNKEQAVQFIGMLKANYKQTATMMIEGMISPIKKPELKQEIKAGMSSTPENVAVTAMESMMDEKSFPQDKIGVPVLAIMTDASFGKTDIDKYLPTIAPKVDLQLWKNVSHFLMMEEPEKFNLALNSFLTKNGL
ncbi:MAG TPA: alpha/beta hydrolase [Pyrinomonadaceae bacterium]|jgi:pimeloyl-ACP methyl ester carboxylesterase|nr:alpha/beta hydrolase [Pyrinomonadaceae bacterium]